MAHLDVPRARRVGNQQARQTVLSYAGTQMPSQLREIHFSVADEFGVRLAGRVPVGSLTVVTGANGSGKTSLLRAIHEEAQHSTSDGDRWRIEEGHIEGSCCDFIWAQLANEEPPRAPLVLRAPSPEPLDARFVNVMTQLTWLAEYPLLVGASTPGAYAPSPLLVAAARFVASAANSLLPLFVVDRHDILWKVAPIPTWRSGSPSIASGLVQLDARNGHRSVSMEHVPGGFRLWVDLAIQEAIERLDAWAEEQEALWARVEVLPDEFEDDALDDYELEAYIREPENFPEFFAVQERTSQFIRLFADPQDADLDERQRFLEDAARRVNSGARPRLYLIDEPEQNLHPALQRQAVAALVALTETGAQVLAATHSPHFLREDAVYVHLNGYMAEPFEPQELSALSVIAADLGFDRGELLCGISLVLYVEGPTDIAVLDTLFRRELHELGVLLVPVRGAVGAHSKGLVDSEIVQRITAARLAVAFDKVTEADIRRLESSAEIRDELSNSKDLELRELARLYQRAARSDRQIATVEVAGEDIFDLLDETSINALFPRFPGHAKARAEAKQSPVHWKRWYLERFDLDLKDLGTFSSIAGHMRERGASSPGLDTMMQRVRSLALGLDRPGV